MNSPQLRVINAAVAVNSCMVEFENDVTACSESFDELASAVENWNFFKQDILQIRTALDEIQRVSDTYGQPTREIKVSALCMKIIEILNKWET